jgi:hypothetical protein
MATLVLIGALGVLQVLVHFRYFLQLRLRAESRDRIFTLTFAAVVGVLMAIGTLWIIADLKRNYLPSKWWIFRVWRKQLSHRRLGWARTAYQERCRQMHSQRTPYRRRHKLRARPALRTKPYGLESPCFPAACGSVQRNTAAHAPIAT